MDVADLVTPQRVFATLQVATNRSFCGNCPSAPQSSWASTHEAILEALRSREMLGSTGVGQGIALPHARVAGLYIFLACLPDWSGQSISTLSMMARSISCSSC